MQPYPPHPLMSGFAVAPQVTMGEKALDPVHHLWRTNSCIGSMTETPVHSCPVIDPVGGEEVVYDWPEFEYVEFQLNDGDLLQLSWYE